MNGARTPGPAGVSAAAQARAAIDHVSPHDINGVLRAGALALTVGAQAEAIPRIEQALRIDAGQPRLWQLLGLLHRGLDQSEAAISALVRGAELAPADAPIANAHARVALDAGLPAVALFERALALAPGDEGALLGLAAACLAGGEAERAIALLEERLARSPGWIAGHRSIARIRWACGERDRFAATLEQAVEAEPANAQLWQTHIELLIQAGLHEELLALVARARAAAGAQRSFDAAEATARAELGETEAADRVFAALLPFDDLPLVVQYVRHLLRAGRIEQAVEIASRAAPGDAHNLLWPYLSAGWRLIGDPRWQWLEGDARLVGVYDLADRIGAIRGLAERLRALHRLPHQPLHQSVRGGTQTEGHLFARIEPEIRAVRELVVEAVEAHAAQLPPQQPEHPLLGVPRAPIRFSGAWSVRLSGGGHHANHVHPAGWLSSAFYIALPGEAERGEGQSGWLALGEPQAELGLDLPPIRMVEPKPGRLVLFPSTMWHGTRPFTAGERLTVAFDVDRPTG
jgi:tetratricopeptide (TPR) repeat protein